MRTSIAVGGLIPLFLLFLCNAIFNGVFTLSLLVCLFLIFIFSLIFIKKVNRKKIVLTCLFCILPLISFCFFYYFRFIPNTKFYEKELTVTGVVYDTPTETETSTSYVLKPLSAYDGEKRIAISGKVSLTDYTGLNAKFYDVVTCKIKVRTVKPASLFNFPMQDRAKGIYLTAIMKEGQITNQKAAKDLTYYSYAIRSKVKEAVNRYVKTDSRALATAVTTGDKTELSEELQSGFTVAGIMHLTAVSGTHFVYILGFIVFLFDILGVSRRKTYVVCLFAGAFICLAAGFSPSVLRAFIVTVIINIGLLIYKETEPFNSLMAAGIIIMLFNPFATGGLSFLLSFLAAAGIITVSGPFSLFLEEHIFKKWKGKGKVVRPVVGTLLATVSATLFTLPVIAYTFLYISAISPVTNLLLVPPASILPLIVFLMCALSAIPAAAGILGFFAGLLTDYISFILKAVSDKTYVLFYADKPYVYIISGILILFLLLRHFNFVKFSRIVAVLLSAAIFFTCATTDFYINHIIAATDKSLFSIKFIGVGQGDSTLIAKDGLGVLVDGGGNYDAGKKIIREMEASGVKKLQAVILTHAHADHINALDEVIRYKSPELLVLPQSADIYPKLLNDLITSAVSTGAEVKNADCDLKINAIKDVRIEVLTRHVLKEETLSDENEFSNVVKVTGNNTTTLIMGDLDETLWRFLKYYNGEKADIIRLGHHGSEGTVTEDFMLRLSPSYAIISVGKDNNYKLPNQSTLDRLKKSNVPYFTTAEKGTITSIITGEKSVFFSLQNG